MGLEMSPGSVISQLDAMNEGLNQIISNGEGALSAVCELAGTESELKGESYDKIREYYTTLHTAAIRGTILYAEAYIEENNTYKSCISGYLSGIGYVNEDALKEARERAEAQLQNARAMVNVSKDYYLTLISSLEDTLFQINKKLEQIENFVNATQGLYQNLDSYKADIKRAIGYLNQSSLDGTDIQYYCDGVTRVWISEITKNWIEKALEVNEQYKEPFIENMEVQFGFDRETAEIFYKLYWLMDIIGDENINQEYFAMIASVCYPYSDEMFKDTKNYLWHFLAGTDTVENVEKIMKAYGLEDNEIEILKREIKVNHDNSQFAKNGKKLDDIPEGELKYYDKSDMAHMSITLSTILKPDESLYEKFGALSGYFNGIPDLNANAGYVGDIYGTAGNGPKLTPDDYKADLDSVNLAERLKNGGNAVIIMNQYYTGIADGTVNRAEEFATNLGNGSFEDGIQLLRKQQKDHGLYNVTQTTKETMKTIGSIMYFPIGFVLRPKLGPEYFELMNGRKEIPERFINFVEDKQNEYTEDDSLDYDYLETGEKKEKSQK